MLGSVANTGLDCGLWYHLQLSIASTVGGYTFYILFTVGPGGYVFAMISTDLTAQSVHHITSHYT